MLLLSLLLLLWYPQVATRYQRYQQCPPAGAVYLECSRQKTHKHSVSAALTVPHPDAARRASTTQSKACCHHHATIQPHESMPCNKWFGWEHGWNYTLRNQHRATYGTDSNPGSINTGRYAHRSRYRQDLDNHEGGNDTTKPPRPPAYRPH